MFRKFLSFFTPGNSFTGIIAYAKKESEKATKVFIESKNRLIKANEHIDKTQVEVSEALADLVATQEMLSSNKDANMKLINNLDGIMDTNK